MNKIFVCCVNTLYGLMQAVSIFHPCGSFGEGRSSTCPLSCFSSTFRRGVFNFSTQTSWRPDVSSSLLFWIYVCMSTVHFDIKSCGFLALIIDVLILFQITLFQQQPQLRQYVRPAIERAVQELIHPVVERSIKICLTTAEMIVKKVCRLQIFLCLN